MIQYLQIKKHHASKNKFIVFREKRKKFDKKVKETYISKKISLIIYGMSASGKTKEIKKLWKAKTEVWANDTFISISSNDSISDWLQTNIKEADKNKYIEDNHIEYKNEGLEVDKEIKKQYVKIQMLINKSKNAIIFIDDIDRLNGKKLEIAKDIMRESKQFICTAEDENNINKTILNMIKKQKVKEINLQTEASYDVTNIFMAMFIIALFATGQMELAGMLMIARFAMKGKGK